ncbi:hypothetical protein BACOVA_05124 [Bacteroides ovatus ATCC 8483]|uniref:Uncharacterized protein n=1 Tax=Bacteroides ovatus (strain ATCC 8483 / DSM 1896 / JCM 5824 / BCRC 10623 / CCUG 4943 / NCTC 11153) TaxID=411476 RepID=A0AAN3A2Y7_BACO1|nr:hypothetical protein BACOVA_05124 [Bacteroides ovatus ATCC 8483]
MVVFNLIIMKCMRIPPSDIIYYNICVVFIVNLSG